MAQQAAEQVPEVRRGRSVSAVWSGLGCSWRRNASVLVWTPVLLLGPVLDVHGSAGSVVFQVSMIVVIAVSAVTAALTGGPPWRSALAPLALATLIAATVAGATHTSSQWLPTWVLLANALPTVLRGRWLLAAVPAAAAASMWAAWAVTPHEVSRMFTEGFVVLLAGAASGAFAALIDTIGELRRTRQELARVAVAEERERFSRDLHDLLGHTLSVMVVKAQAVRRLVAQDPEAAAQHAADIEKIGRRALVDVRQAVDAMRAPSLGEELDGAQRALDAAGIATTVDRSGITPTSTADELLAWVVREGATNVLRHSGASACQITLADADGGTALTIADDGAGASAAPTMRLGGIEGLRSRLAAAGGELSVEREDDGFRLVATVPGGSS
jgi:two-component system sensor histidine kinase DesK